MHFLHMLLVAATDTTVHTTTTTTPSLLSLGPWLALIPLIVAPLTTYITQALRKVSEGLDAAGPTTKRIVVAVIAILLNWVGLRFGIAIPGTMEGVTPDALTTILMGLLSTLGAMGVYHLPNRLTGGPATTTGATGALGASRTYVEDRRDFTH